MPSLHVVGEILGAAGVAHEKVLSLSRVMDLLALDPESSKSYFCRWRLLISGDELDGDADSNDSRDGGAAWADTTWEVVHGDEHGQTHVHAPSNSLSVPLEETTSRVLLDVVWSHPIDLHLSSSVAFTGWPHLELEVWSLDRFHQSQLCGSARICVPSTSHEHFLDVPLARSVPSSWLERLTESLSLSDNDSTSSSKDATPLEQWPRSQIHRDKATHKDKDALVEPSGSVLLRIAVLQSGL